MEARHVLFLSCLAINYTHFQHFAITSKEEEIREVKQEIRNLFRYSLAAKMTDQQHFSLSSERFSLSMDLQLLELERFRLYNKASALGLVP